MAAISAVFTISRVAAMLGEEEDWLFDLAIDMFPRRRMPARLRRSDDEGITAFTEYGIECLRQIIEDERRAGRAPPRRPPPSAP